MFGFSSRGCARLPFCPCLLSRHLAVVVVAVIVVAARSVFVRGPARREKHMMSSDEPLFIATDSIDGIWPFLQSVSLVRCLFSVSVFFLLFPLFLFSVFLPPSIGIPPPCRRFRRRGDGPSFSRLTYFFLSFFHVHTRTSMMSADQGTY